MKNTPNTLGGFDRTRLPDPVDYYTAQGLVFRERKGKWRTTECRFHGGTDSLRINTSTGAFVCMAGCGARGGDVLAYHMAEHGQDFTTAAKELGAWTDGGTPPARPTPLPARDALHLLAREANLIAITAVSISNGMKLTEADRERVLKAGARINTINGIFQ